MAQQEALAFRRRDLNIPVDDNNQALAIHQQLHSLSDATPRSQPDRHEWELPTCTVQVGIVEWVEKKEKELRRETVL